ncbi:MAG: tetratricopeptide repeat protein [Planctomycetaceae bacterium]
MSSNRGSARSRHSERPAEGRTRSAEPPSPDADPSLVGDAGSRWLTFVLQVGVIALAVLWIYSPVCDTTGPVYVAGANPTFPVDWLWDDDQLLTANLTVQHFLAPDPAQNRPAPVRDDLRTLGKLWFDPDGADYFPLSYTALWAQWPFFQMDPRTGGPVQPGGPAVAWPTGYHVTTMLLHVLGALAVWRLFAVLGVPGAWLGGLLFAVHPVCVESVAWVSELKNTLSLPLFLLSAASYVRFDDLVHAGASEDDSRVLTRYGAALGLFLLAMFAKTSVVAMPVLILLYAWWKRNTVTFRDLVYSAPFFATSIVLGVITISYQHGRAIGQETIVVPSYIGNGSANYREGGVRVSARAVEITRLDGSRVHAGPLQAEADFDRVPLEWRQKVRDVATTGGWKDFPGDGRVRIFDDPATKSVYVSAVDGRPIFAGPLREPADLEKVPADWQRRVRAIDRGTGWPSLKGLLSRMAIAGTSFLFYLVLFVWPVNLLPIYPRWDIDLLDVAKGSEAGEMLFYLLPIPVILGAAWWLWRHREGWGRHVILGVGFFLLMVAPVLGFITISYMRITWAADHFIYLPMIGLIGLVSAAVATWYRRAAADERPLIVVGAAVVIAALTLVSFNLAACWVHEDALWTHTLAHNPNAWQAHNRLGAKKFSRGHVESFGAENGLRPEVDVVKTRIGPATRIQNLGAFYHFSWSTHLRPDLGETHNNLGTAWSARAQMAAQQGNKQLAEACMSKAVEQFAEACRVTPHVPAIHVNLANALAAAGRFDEAAAKYRELLEKEPNNPALINNYGVALYKSGKTEESIVQFRRALALAPGLKDAQESLAVALGEKPDPAKQQPAEQPPPPGQPAPPQQPALPPLDLQPPKSPTLGPTIR